MAGIFPPHNNGGVPPGPNVACAYTPEHPVVGEGPFFVASDCSTIFTDCQANSWTSEILASVDKLGFAYSSGRVDNLGEALVETVDQLNRNIDTRVAKAGDIMTGQLVLAAGDPVNDNEAARKLYVDARDVVERNNMREYVDGQDAAITQAWQAATSLLGQQKINRAGDRMQGPLMLYGEVPTDPDEATPKNYVDARVERGGDTMEGPLILSRSPVEAMEAATKQYADSIIGEASGKVDRDGDTMTGPLILHGEPPTGEHEAVDKFYVDSQIATGGTFVDAASDGSAYGRRNASWIEVLPLEGGGDIAGDLSIDGHLKVDSFQVGESGSMTWDGTTMHIDGAHLWTSVNLNPAFKVNDPYGQGNQLWFDGANFYVSTPGLATMLWTNHNLNVTALLARIEQLEQRVAQLQGGGS